LSHSSSIKMENYLSFPHIFCFFSCSYTVTPFRMDNYQS
jgi:hypothetical protein